MEGEGMKPELLSAEEIKKACEILCPDDMCSTPQTEICNIEKLLKHYESVIIPARIAEGRKEWERELNNPEINQLAQDLYLPLLAQWIAIENNETRLQADQYMNQAQELADYLSVIGYLTGESHRKLLASAMAEVIAEIEKLDIIDEYCLNQWQSLKQRMQEKYK
jgi:hypothetical protein